MPYFSPQNLDAWRRPYASQPIISIEDREMICSVLCTVINICPPEQWLGSLDALAQPILSCLDVNVKEADRVTSGTGAAEQRENDVALIIDRLSIEVRLLAAVVRCFVEADVSKNFSGESRAMIIAYHRNALVALLHKSWPTLTYVAKQYCAHEVS